GAEHGARTVVVRLAARPGVLVPGSSAWTHDAVSRGGPAADGRGDPPSTRTGVRSEAAGPPRPEVTMANPWPEITLSSWRETCAALQLYAQVIGKYRLARTPWQNHSWHATLYVTARGLDTSPVPDGPGAIDLELDLLGHAVVGRASSGRSAQFQL